MRQITEQAVLAFKEGRNFNKSNTTVNTNYVTSSGRPIVELSLYGNLIARTVEDQHGNRELSINDGGWQTVTTKERLNALPGVNIQQKDWQWYLNGNAWNGEWTTIKWRMSDDEFNNHYSTAN